VLTSLRSHVAAIVGGFLVGALLGYLGSMLLPTSYTATSSVYFAVDAFFTPVERGPGDPVRFVADQAELLVTTDVLKRAGDRVSPSLSVEDVRQSVETTPSPDSSRVTVRVERPDAEQARALADAVVASYREVVAERIAATVSTVSNVITEPVVQGETMMRAVAYGDGVAAVEPATLPEAASAPRPVQNALVAGLLGALLVIGLAMLQDQRRAHRASVADLDLLLGAPLLARYAAPVSKAGSEAVSTDASPDQIRAGHDVLMAIDVALEDTPRPSVLFLSWQLANTTTSLVVSVALAAARRTPRGLGSGSAPVTGPPVVLVDGGLKERGITALMGVQPGGGLEALANPANPVLGSLRRWRTGDIELGVVPLDGSSGPNRAAVRPQVLRSATARLSDLAAITLVDGPPLTEHSLGLALGRGVDGVVLVIDEETSVDDAHEMGRRIALAGVVVLGYVLVGPVSHRSTDRVSRSLQRRGEDDGRPVVTAGRLRSG